MKDFLITVGIAVIAYKVGYLIACEDAKWVKLPPMKSKGGNTPLSTKGKNLCQC
jgi:hypothetical protein